MVAPMFGLPNLFTIERRFLQMTSQLQELRDEVAALKQDIRDEKAQVDDRFAELETKIEDLLTQPSEEMDLSEVLNDVRALRTDVANIYEPSSNPEPTPIEDEDDDMPTVELTEEQIAEQEHIEDIKAETDVPEGDVIVSIPDHSVPAEGEVEGVVFKD